MEVTPSQDEGGGEGSAADLGAKREEGAIWLKPSAASVARRD